MDKNSDSGEVRASAEGVHVWSDGVSVEKVKIRGGGLVIALIVAVLVMGVIAVVAICKVVEVASIKHDKSSCLQLCVNDC